MDLKEVTLPNTDLPVCLNQESLLACEELRLMNSMVCPPPVLARSLRLIGPLDPQVLQQALDEIVRRHSALRAYFYPNASASEGERQWGLMMAARTGLIVSGLYRQSVGEDIHIAVSTVDLEGFYGQKQDTEGLGIYYEAINASFDMKSAPLMRAVLIRFNAYDHRLLLVWNHIICDAISAQIVCDEFAELYRYYSGESEYPFFGRPAGFPDYAAWQQQQLPTSHYHKAMTYWRDQWARYGSARVGRSDLPFAPPPPKVPRFGVESVELSFSEMEATAIRTSARQSKITLQTLFVAAYGLVLHHYTCKSAIGLWNHFANRSRIECANSVGCFASTHLIGLDFAADPKGQELLYAARRVIAEGYSHAEMPLSMLWSSLLCYPRFPDVRALVQVDVRSPVPSPARFGALSITDEALDALPGVRFSNLGIYLHDDGTHASASFQYAPDLCPQLAAQALLEDVMYAVREMVANPEKRASQYSRLADRYRGSPCGRRMEMDEFVLIGSHLIPSLVD